MLRMASGALLLLALIVSAAACAQDTVTPASSFSAGYPGDQPGVFIQGSSWTELPNAVPVKIKAAHGFVASFSDGMVPAKIIAEYKGDHSSAEVNPGRPVICICRFLSLPDQPVIVRLHPKKGARELDGGTMFVYPLVGGRKWPEAKKSDLIPVEVSQADPHVWLVRSQATLEPGEYALMLGTKNMSIFSFTVAEASENSATAVNSAAVVNSPTAR
ncbi:MAG TPA: hypothetical protein VGS10_07410 [Terracidiphilus sp.]|nr:hypothetical protein [Terracidiphilus sp.]